MTDCIFCQIAQKEQPATIIYEDDEIIAFDDIFPKAPIHKLIIPKTHIATINDLTADTVHLVGKMTMVAQKIAKELNIAERGYRLQFNCNKEGGQVVYHIHMHLFGGRQLST